MAYRLVQSLRPLMGTVEYDGKYLLCFGVGGGVLGGVVSLNEVGNLEFSRQIWYSIRKEA
jgi:hypothetical protein